MSGREEFFARWRAYLALFTTTFTRRLSRWQLLALSLRALVSRRPFYELSFIASYGAPNPAAEEVLEDLRRFCGIDRGGIVVSPVTRTADPIATAYRAGQRDVFLRIAGFVGFDEAQLREKSRHVSEQADS